MTPQSHYVRILPEFIWDCKALCRTKNSSASSPLEHVYICALQINFWLCSYTFPFQTKQGLWVGGKLRILKKGIPEGAELYYFICSVSQFLTCTIQDCTFSFMPYILFILLFPLFALGSITMLILSLSSTMNYKSSTLDHAKLFQMYFLDDLALVPSHLDVEMVIN